MSIFIFPSNVLTAMSLCVLMPFVHAQSPVPSSEPRGFLALQAGVVAEEALHKAENPEPAPAPVRRLPSTPPHRALRALDNAPVGPAQELPIGIPPIDGIYRIEPEKSLDASDDVETFIEQIKVKDLVEEVRKMQRLGRTNEAIEMLENNARQMKTPGALFEVHHQLGIMLYSLNLYREAAVHLEKALSFQANSAAVACNLAAIFLYLGEVDSALQSLGRVETSSLFENNQRSLLFSTYFNYACAYSLKNMVEESLANIELAARYDPQRVLTSMGDPQLDNVRRSPRFQEIKDQLTARIQRR